MASRSGTLQGYDLTPWTGDLTMAKTIVFPTDFSTASDVALEHAAALAESAVAHGEALKRLLQNNVRFAGVPKDVMTRARKVAGELIEEIGAGSAVARKIVDSYRATQIALRPRDRVSRVPAED